MAALRNHFGVLRFTNQGSVGRSPRSTAFPALFWLRGGALIGARFLFLTLTLSRPDSKSQGRAVVIVGIMGAVGGDTSMTGLSGQG